MPEEEITYYAITGRGKTVDDPHGIVRRRRSPDIGTLDEALQRDLQWHRTGIIVEWEHSSFSDELEEVSEEKAMQIVEAFRAGGPY
ncbi:hypothetical protein AB0C21_23980 [Spirillospora sp. NPDC049024]